MHSFQAKILTIVFQQKLLWITNFYASLKHSHYLKSSITFTNQKLTICKLHFPGLIKFFIQKNPFSKPKNSKNTPHLSPFNPKVHPPSSDTHSLDLHLIISLTLHLHSPLLLDSAFTFAFQASFFSKKCTQIVLYVCSKPTTPDFAAHQPAASVLHYFKSCRDCFWHFSLEAHSFS